MQGNGEIRRFGGGECSATDHRNFFCNVFEKTWNARVKRENGNEGVGLIKERAVSPLEKTSTCSFPT